MKQHRVMQFLLAVAIPVGVLCLSTTAGGQTRHLTAEELVRSSDVVAVGKIRQKSSAWNAGKTRIETTVAIEVSEYIKGKSDGTILVVTPGGEVGGVGELYSHTPRFEKDEEVLLFVKRDRENRLRVNGGPAGKLKVITDPSTGGKRVEQGDPLTAYVAGLKKIAGGAR